MKPLVLSLPLIVTACLGVFAPMVGSRLPPRHATWLLSAGSMIAACSGLAVLAMLGSVAIGQQPDLAREGQWSVVALRTHAPADLAIEAGALLAGLALAAAAVVVAGRRGIALHAAYRGSRRLEGASSELIVIPGAATEAYAIPGRPGRIVIGQALLRALSPIERQALLAHERSHLRNRHHWHLVAVTTAATLNPLLLPLRQAAEHAAERWADEDAATAIGDRRTVATALARAALVPVAQPGFGLAAATHDVPRRVAALLAAPQRSQPALLGATVLMLLIGAIAAVVATKQTEHLFEFARSTYLAGGQR